ncbi:LAETG motif-containing sortase-dependent surface protein [Streptomyces sp. NPDC012623]|uniref:LAETG motif-containing sortase-dependent surface protein n=1 Tax=unclassified Streptomyces TaxID=2593676 RepID=UPI0036BD8B2F
MAISRRVTALRLLGTGAAALALTTAAAGSAWASDCPGGKGWDKGNHGGYKPGQGAGTPVTPVTTTDKCEFSLDGRDWYSQIKVDDLSLKAGDDGKVHVKVRTSSDAAKCTVSLASYRTHGATWNTSGEQVFHDFDSVEIKHGGQDTLDVAFPDVGCYAQVDLYRGKVKYDGLKDANDGFEHGDLPIGPSRSVIKDQLIAAWNGGTKDCTAQEIPPVPEPSVTESTPEESPTESTPSTGTPSEPASPSPSASETDETPATGSSPTPSASEPSSTGSTPANEPSQASTGGNGGAEGDLAETGGGNVVPIAAGAAVLLAAGGAVVIMTRRRKAATGS